MTFFHGILVNEPTDGIRPILEKSTAIIGLVATATAAAGAATNALNAAFPLNRPVLVTDVRKAVGLAGTGGTLKNVLGAIADQGSPLAIVVRVAEGEDLAETQANVIGATTGGAYTGLQALLVAEAVVGVKPRIIGVPGFDSQQVVEAMIVVAQRLRGFVYAACRTGAALCDTLEAATTYREQFSARECMLIWPDWTGFDGQQVAIALGKRAMLDETRGWHFSLSNNPVNGVTGINKDVHFDIHDSANDAGVLNAAQVTTLVRTGSGYRYWGNRTTSDEPFFGFEVATRTAQALQDVIADAVQIYGDRPLTVGLVKDIIETANATGRRYVNQRRLIGFKAWFDASLNPREQLAAGKLVIDYDYTPDAPLEGLEMNQRITTKYYAGFGDALNGAGAA